MVSITLLSITHLGVGYVAKAKLGLQTDTMDPSGAVVATSIHAHATRELLESVLPRFVGRQLQQPPVYSAIKIGGQRYSDLARRAAHQASIHPAPEATHAATSSSSSRTTSTAVAAATPPPSAPPLREVEVYQLECTHWAPPEFELTLQCSSGFYVRRLVDDLGLAMGTHATLVALCRTQQGPFLLRDAIEVGFGEEDRKWEIVLRIRTALSEY